MMTGLRANLVDPINELDLDKKASNEHDFPKSNRSRYTRVVVFILGIYFSF